MFNICFKILSMCHFKSWFVDNNGYVVNCERCNYFQVCFGTTMLTLSADDYQIFTFVVAQKKEDHVAMQDPNVRCVVVPTPCNSIHFLITERELGQLHHMLQEVDSEMKAQHLIGMFARNAG